MLPAREWPDDGPAFKQASVTLFAMGPQGMVYACNVGDKRDLLRGTSGPLWAAWTGRYHSDVFVVQREQAEAEIGLEGVSGKPPDPAVQKMLDWFVGEVNRAGLGPAKSPSPRDAKAAEKLLKAVSRGMIASVAQWALKDDRPGFSWRGHVLTVSKLHEKWGSIVSDWERDGAPEYEAAG
jgi:hypothetical protein